MLLSEFRAISKYTADPATIAISTSSAATHFSHLRGGFSSTVCRHADDDVTGWANHLIFTVW